MVLGLPAAAPERRAAVLKQHREGQWGQHGAGGRKQVLCSKSLLHPALPARRASSRGAWRAVSGESAPGPGRAAMVSRAGANVTARRSVWGARQSWAPRMPEPRFRPASVSDTALPGTVLRSLANKETGTENSALLNSACRTESRRLALRATVGAHSALPPLSRLHGSLDSTVQGLSKLGCGSPIRRPSFQPRLASCSEQGQGNRSRDKG